MFEFMDNMDKWVTFASNALMVAAIIYFAIGNHKKGNGLMVMAELVNRVRDRKSRVEIKKMATVMAEKYGCASELDKAVKKSEKKFNRPESIGDGSKIPHECVGDSAD